MSIEGISIPVYTLALSLALLLLSHVTNALSNNPTRTLPTLVLPEVSPQRLEQVSHWVAMALGDKDKCKHTEGDTSNGPLEVSSPGTSTDEESSTSTKLKKDDRYAMARRAALEWESSSQMESYELVYGELSLPLLTTILDAVGVYPGDKFLDIGSGDGGLVFGASLLYAGDDENDNDYQENAISIARGLEIVPGLYERSLQHHEKLSNILQETDARFLGRQQSPIEFHLGDIYQASSSDDSIITNILEDSTLVVCFATTWSAGNAAAEEKTSLQGRKLPQLSKALQALPKGARVVIVDGRLDSKDGHEWQGDLKIYCPDTAPWSIASLYYKR